MTKYFERLISYFEHLYWAAGLLKLNGSVRHAIWYLRKYHSDKLELAHYNPTITRFTFPIHCRAKKWSLRYIIWYIKTFLSGQIYRDDDKGTFAFMWSHALEEVLFDKN